MACRTLSAFINVILKATRTEVVSASSGYDIIQETFAGERVRVASDELEHRPEGTGEEGAQLIRTFGNFRLF